MCGFTLLLHTLQVDEAAQAVAQWSALRSGCVSPPAQQRDQRRGPLVADAQRRSRPGGAQGRDEGGGGKAGEQASAGFGHRIIRGEGACCTLPPGARLRGKRPV